MDGWVGGREKIAMVLKETLKERDELSGGQLQCEE